MLSGLPAGFPISKKMAQAIQVGFCFQSSSKPFAKIACANVALCCFLLTFSIVVVWLFTTSLYMRAFMHDCVSQAIWGLIYRVNIFCRFSFYLQVLFNCTCMHARGLQVTWGSIPLQFRTHLGAHASTARFTCARCGVPKRAATNGSKDVDLEPVRCVRACVCVCVFVCVCVCVRESVDESDTVCTVESVRSPYIVCMLLSLSVCCVCVCVCVWFSDYQRHPPFPCSTLCSTGGVERHDAVGGDPRAPTARPQRRRNLA